MKIKNTYIVNDDSRITLLYETEDGRFFIPYHIVGQVTEITKNKAMKLLNK